MPIIIACAATLIAIGCSVRLISLRRREKAGTLEHDYDCTCLDCQNTRWSRKV